GGEGPARAARADPDAGGQARGGGEGRGEAPRAWPGGRGGAVRRGPLLCPVRRGGGPGQKGRRAGEGGARRGRQGRPAGGGGAGGGAGAGGGGGFPHPRAAGGGLGRGGERGGAGIWGGGGGVEAWEVRQRQEGQRGGGLAPAARPQRGGSSPAAHYRLVPLD